MRSILRRLFVVIIVTCGMSGPALADLKVSSWNIKHLGWGEDKNYQQVAHIISGFDIMAIQEVMDESALKRVVQTLNATTSHQWDYLASHAIGRGSYKELYGFVYRTDAVTYDSGAVVYIDDRDVFAREPLSAQFVDRQTGKPFVMATIHVLYGDSKADRAPEIHALASYWDWLRETYGEVPVMMMGDFNFSPHDAVFAPLRRAGATPMITSGKTTLSPRNGRFASLYDNIWIEPGTLGIAEKGIINFPQVLGINHKTARKTVSDHAPIYIVVSDMTARASNPADVRQAPATPPAKANAGNCIDLNHSSAHRLADLPHVGEKRSQQIVAGRPWHSAAELTRINGIGTQRVKDIQSYQGLCRL